jgi:hypothetical protein
MIPRVALTLSILSLFALSVVLVPTLSMRIASAVAGADGSSSGTLTKIRSGLVSEDALTNGGYSGCGSGANSTGNINTGYWFIFGDAKHEGATWTACEDASGLWLGVQSIESGEFAGIYAESPDGDVMLYHADLTFPAKTIQDVGTKSFNTGLYVQTYDGFLNYIACYGQVNPNGDYYWAAEAATGNKQQVTGYKSLFQGPTLTTGGPSTEDCAIVTNGANLLQVYMNGTLEYSSTNARLNMPEPFNAYLEVESANANVMLFGQYRDYYDTLSNAVSIQDVPAGDTAEITSGPTVMASSTNKGSSPATLALNVAQYELPIWGTLEVSSGSTVVAATSGADFWGGDTYAFGASSTTTTAGVSSPLTVDSENIVGNAIAGYHTGLYHSGGGLIQAGYTPQVYVLNDGSGYQVEADSYGPCTFAHWSGAGVTGSTDDPVPIAIAGPTTLTAVYSGPDCGSQTMRTTTTTTSTGRPSVTVESVDQDGQPIAGYYSVLRTSAGVAVASGYTQRTYMAVTAGERYEIQLDSYGGCTFDHWQATGGSTADPLPFTQADGPITFVGVFDCTSSGSLAQTSLIAMLSGAMAIVPLPVTILAVALGSLLAIDIQVDTVGRKTATIPHRLASPARE